jgi:hypothetical protein
MIGGLSATPARVAFGFMAIVRAVPAKRPRTRRSHVVELD